MRNLREFARVEPNAVALVANVNFDFFKIGFVQYAVAFRAFSFGAFCSFFAEFGFHFCNENIRFRVRVRGLPKLR